MRPARSLQSYRPESHAAYSAAAVGIDHPRLERFRSSSGRSDISVAAPAETMPFLKNDRRLVLFLALVIRFIVLLLLPSVVIVVTMAAGQEVIEDEIGDVATEPLPTRQVVAEVHARENAALRCFVGGCRDARERADRAR